MCYICWEIGAFWLICYILAQNGEFKCQNFETSTLTENIRKMSSHSNNTHNREKSYFIRLYYSVFLGIEAQISTKVAKKKKKKKKNGENVRFPNSAPYCTKRIVNLCLFRRSRKVSLDHQITKNLFQKLPKFISHMFLLHTFVRW